VLDNTATEDEMRVNPTRAADLVKSLATIRNAVAKTNTADRKVRLVAVSKLKPASDILSLVEAKEPQYHFGENYVQELQHKAEILPRSIRWHFIGGLQTNKCKSLAEGIPNLWCVASVDTAKKADQLEKGRAALCESDQGKDVQKEGGLHVYVQVNTSGEESKSGVEPGDASMELCKHIREKCPHLKLSGLMTIGAIARSKAGGENEDFVALVKERESIVKALDMQTSDLELSMGMSADFEEAIRQGSNEVRVGSQIFGARPPKQSKEAKEQVEEGKD